MQLSQLLLAGVLFPALFVRLSLFLCFCTKGTPVRPTDATALREPKEYCIDGIQIILPTKRGNFSGICVGSNPTMHVQRELRQNG